MSRTLFFLLLIFCIIHKIIVLSLIIIIFHRNIRRSNNNGFHLLSCQCRIYRKTHRCNSRYVRCCHRCPCIILIFFIKSTNIWNCTVNFYAWCYYIYPFSISTKSRECISIKNSISEQSILMAPICFHCTYNNDSILNFWNCNSCK